MAQTVFDTFLGVFVGFLYQSLIPIVFATALIIVGYLIGSLFKMIVVKLVERPRINDWLEEQNISTTVGGHTIAVILGTIVQWSIVALFLSQVTQSLRLTVISDILTYIATSLIWGILLALVIFLVGLLIGRYVRNMIEATTSRFKRFFALGIEAVIIYMALIMALSVIKGADNNPIIPVDILQQTFIIAFTGFILTLALVVGLSFGFALKDDAKEIIKDLKTKKK